MINDRHGAYVGALHLNSCGEVPRSWREPSLPDHDQFLIVETPLTTATAHLLATHNPSDRTSGLAHLAIHSSASC